MCIKGTITYLQALQKCLEISFAYGFLHYKSILKVSQFIAF